MKVTFKKYIIPLIIVVTGIILFNVWKMNGSELKDSWLYVVSFVIVIVSCIDIYRKEK